MEECQHLIHLLGCYEAASGQAINRHNTSIFFSRNTRQEVKADFQELMGRELWRIVKNTLAFLWWEVNQRWILLMNYKRKLLCEWWDGKRNSSLKQVEKSWLKQFLKQFLLTLWVSFKSQRLYVILSTLLWLNMGGGPTKDENKSIGLIGINYVR